ncbi:MAG TPA: hypothetical protein VEX60_08045 [Pyrinomonadaceae bacterium]|nr:hypothetical protein [Pyrinomonadaceae bacterium]
MKHRSVITFILLAAALFAAPQISNDLSALKSALGARIRGEILHTLLNLRADDGASELVTRRANPLLASYQARDKACPQALAATKKSDGRSQAQPRVEATAKTDAGERLAMLIDPTSGTEIVKAALSNVETRVVLGEAAALPRSFFAQGDLAMLNAPDSVVGLPSFADALANGSNEKEAVRRWEKSAEKQMRVAYVASGLEKLGAQKMAEETLRRIGPTLNDAGATRATEKGMRLKLLNVRRANRDGVGNSKAAAPQPARVNATMPVPVAALVPPDLAPLPSGCATDGE